MGSKIDKAQARAVKWEEGKALAERMGAGFVEVSSRTGENVKVPFVETVEGVLASPGLMEGTRKKGAPVSVEPDRWEAEGGGGCAC